MCTAPVTRPAQLRMRKVIGWSLIAVFSLHISWYTYSVLYAVTPTLLAECMRSRLPYITCNAAFLRNRLLHHFWKREKKWTYDRSRTILSEHESLANVKIDFQVAFLDWYLTNSHCFVISRGALASLFPWIRDNVLNKAMHRCMHSLRFQLTR